MRIAPALTALFVGIALHLPAQAQAPLVSGINGSLGAFGGWGRSADGGSQGWYNPGIQQFFPTLPDICDIPTLCIIVSRSGGKKASGFEYGGEGRVALPMGSWGGVQADGTIGHAFGGSFDTARLHIFAGQPGLGTIGPFVQRMWSNGARETRLGGEAQLWLNTISLYANAGYQWGKDSSTFEVRSKPFACGEVRWYFIDDAFIGVGGSWTSFQQAGFANGELQLGGDLRAVSLFARGGMGTDHYRVALVGARYQFGNGPTLLARHRQDLPLPYGECGQEQFTTGGVGIFFFNIE